MQWHVVLYMYDLICWKPCGRERKSKHMVSLLYQLITDGHLISMCIEVQISMGIGVQISMCIGMEKGDGKFHPSKKD